VKGCGPVRIAEFHTSRLDCGQRVLGPPRDGVALGFSDEGYNAYSQVVGLGPVDGEKARAAVAGKVQGPGLFRPVGAAAAFNLGEAGPHLGIARGRKVVDRTALRCQPETGCPLPGRRDPLAGDKSQGWRSGADHVQTCVTLVWQMCSMDRRLGSISVPSEVRP
jgi:hypothetical protein